MRANCANTLCATRRKTLDKYAARSYTRRPMINLDQLEWTDYSGFTLFGARIGIRSNNVAALAALARGFPPHWKTYSGSSVDWQYSLWLAPPTRSGRRPFHTLYSNAEQLARSPEIETLVSAFERDVQLAVAQKARRRVFVHAGVVAWNGRAIVIPGKSYSGKSTLVRELVRAGATYYSDEYAVLDDHGNVHPFARQLALRDENHANQKLSFEELGGKIGKRPVPVGTILVTKYRERARWRPKLLTPGLGALELLANTVTARSGQPLVLEVLTRVATNARTLKSARGEADVLAGELLRYLGSHNPTRATGGNDNT